MFQSLHQMALSCRSTDPLRKLTVSVRNRYRPLSPLERFAIITISMFVILCQLDKRGQPVDSTCIDSLSRTIIPQGKGPRIATRAQVHSCEVEREPKFVIVIGFEFVGTFQA